MSKVVFIVKKFFFIIVIVTSALIISACSNEKSEGENDFLETFSGSLEHVHGLGYAGNTGEIFLAAHDGLKIYKNGDWYKTKIQNNDYMGFNAVDKGFYTSGHPGKGVNLPNPLGIMRSFDNGQTLEEIAFKGESDFHAMGVGYFNHTIYILNSHENSKLRKGLYVSRDEGKSWDKLAAENLGEKVFSIAVHPTNDEILAVASQDGIFISKDAGESFELITSNKQGTTVSFSEEILWYGTYDQKAYLNKYLLNDESSEEISLPDMSQDAVMYIAQNPINKSEVVFISFNGSVYITNELGNSWEQIVNNGKLSSN
jgi:photosystem II stability/assembly factor-like uncharacterized protein